MAIQPRNLEQLQVFSMRAPAALTAVGDTTGVDLRAIDGDALFILDASTSAADTSMQAKLQHADTVGGTYADVPGGAFVTLTAAASTQKLSIPRDENRGFYRINFNTEVGNFSGVVSCVAVGSARYAV